MSKTTSEMRETHPQKLKQRTGSRKRKAFYHETRSERISCETISKPEAMVRLNKRRFQIRSDPWAAGEAIGRAKKKTPPKKGKRGGKEC